MSLRINFVNPAQTSYLKCQSYALHKSIEALHVCEVKCLERFSVVYDIGKLLIGGLVLLDLGNAVMKLVQNICEFFFVPKGPVWTRVGLSLVGYSAYHRGVRDVCRLAGIQRAAPRCVRGVEWCGVDP